MATNNFSPSPIPYINPRHPHQLEFDFGTKVQGKNCKIHPDNDWRWRSNMDCIICAKQRSLVSARAKRARIKANRAAEKARKISTLF